MHPFLEAAPNITQIFGLCDRELSGSCILSKPWPGGYYKISLPARSVQVGGFSEPLQTRMCQPVNVNSLSQLDDAKSHTHLLMQDLFMSIDEPFNISKISKQYTV